MRAMAAIAMIVFLAGCTGMQVGTPYTQPCKIYETFGATPENSVIAQKIANPCAAQQLLATAAKLPVIWGKKEYIDQFNKWSGIINQHLVSGITYKALQDILVMEVAKFNTEAGLTLLILSDGVFVFGSVDTPLMPMDQKLLIASLNDLRVQVANLSLIAVK